MNMQLSYKEGVLTAFLAGEIDHHSAREMREQIDEAAQKHKPYCLRLDFSQVPFMDSSGIGLILGRVRLCGFWTGCPPSWAGWWSCPASPVWRP